MISKEEFITAYCKRSKVAWKWLSEYRHVVPCDCGEKGCEGWAMVPLYFTTYNGLPRKEVKR